MAMADIDTERSRGGALPLSRSNRAPHVPNRGMLMWGPWLLFAVGILMILATSVGAAGSVEGTVARGRVEGADVVVAYDVGGAEQTRYVREVAAGEILIVCGSLLMIAGVALPRLGLSPAKKMWLSETENTSDGGE
jgi:hypothetical protein